MLEVVLAVLHKVTPFPHTTTPVVERHVDSVGKAGAYVQA
jgi:hypothetical protein